ncbi:MAG: TonB-dependent receptor [Desulfobacteraceae bacterium]|nr:MAG: TonB-dependent receptor [Desulfobacteraceae bacterium]
MNGKKINPRILIIQFILFVFFFLSLPAWSQNLDDLMSLSIEELIDVEVVSVSRLPEKPFTAPAAVSVITQEDIPRSGYTSIAEILRMVPGLEVAQIDGNKFAISSRGFNGRYANKLLVQMDGRTLYSSLHSGVYWEVQDYLLQDIERIEIVRGPGATLWGVNAVNGIINIVTKSSKDTQGGYADAAYGNKVQFGDLRYGGAAGENFTYRIYGKYVNRDPQLNVLEEDAHDGSEIPQGGFRCDWDLTEKESLRVSGDYYNGNLDQDYTTASAGGLKIEGVDTDVTGCNTLLNYDRQMSATSNLSLNLYYDRTERDDIKLEDRSDIFDVDFQHSFRLCPRNDFIWGVGYRHIEERTQKVSQTEFLPSDPDLDSTSGFLQDKITLMPDFLFLTLGTKIENNFYTNVEYQPNARILLTPDEHQSVWGSVARAVRTPSILEDSILISIPAGPDTITVLEGNNDMDSESLIAYELGYRIRPVHSVTFDIAGFFNDYDQLASNEIIDDTPTFGNRFAGETYGGEIAANWVLSESMKFIAWYSYLDGHIKDKDSNEKSSADTLPRNQVNLRSYFNLPKNFTFDTSFYYVDDNKSGTRKISEYYRFDARVGWRPAPNLEFSIAGQNLLVYQDGGFVGEHQEYITLKPDSGLVERSVYAKVAFTW